MPWYGIEPEPILLPIGFGGFLAALDFGVGETFAEEVVFDGFAFLFAVGAGFLASALRCAVLRAAGAAFFAGAPFFAGGCLPAPGFFGAVAISSSP